MAYSASHRRLAVFAIMSKMDWRSDAELLMAARISPVAFCRSSASACSRLSLAVSCLTPAVAVLLRRGPAVFLFLVALRAGDGRLAIPALETKLKYGWNPTETPYVRTAGKGLSIGAVPGKNGRFSLQIHPSIRIFEAVVSALGVRSRHSAQS